MKIWTIVIGGMTTDNNRGCSSVGRAPALHAGGREFDSVDYAAPPRIIMTVEELLAEEKNTISKSRPQTM